VNLKLVVHSQPACLYRVERRSDNSQLANRRNRKPVVAVLAGQLLTARLAKVRDGITDLRFPTDASSTERGIATNIPYVSPTERYAMS